MSSQQTYALDGGLDQETPWLAIKPGRAIGVLNHESCSRGYRRTEGYERYDGHLAPSDTLASVLTFEMGRIAFVAGTTIVGASTGATARVLLMPALTSGAFILSGGTATGSLYVLVLTGTFSTGEVLLVGGTPYAKLVSLPNIIDRLEGADADAAVELGLAYSRGLIAKVPGSGSVRGVLWYNGMLHAWRDNLAGTRCVLHHATASGWVATDLGKSLAFTLGGPYVIKVGDTITGLQSGGTATVRSVAADPNGSWADKKMTGSLILDNIVGALGNENISVGANANVATINVGPQQVYFPAGGRYFFKVFNFYGSVGTERAYGVNGVSQAFEFDGSTVVFIATGMPDDRPFLVTEHKNHLFLAFPKGSLQHSQLGEPRSFSARLGAAEFGLGHEITNLIPNAVTTLMITTTETLSLLTGTDVSDWVLEGLSNEAGAKIYTAQRIGQIIYLDNRGVRSATSTPPYGNFRLGAYTTLINRELEAKRKAGLVPVASCVVKSKDQYLLFFSDGSALSLYFGRKNPEGMLFKYAFVPTCLYVVEVNGIERVFSGGDDGYVYDLNRGTSFDGAEIEAYVQLAFSHQGDPRLLKRYVKNEIELVSGPQTQLKMLAVYDDGGGNQPYSFDDALLLNGGGGLWGVANWGDFIWSAPIVARAESWLEGLGCNVSLILASTSTKMESYILQAVTTVFNPRGRKR